MQTISAHQRLVQDNDWHWWFARDWAQSPRESDCWSEGNLWHQDADSSSFDPAEEKQSKFAVSLGSCVVQHTFDDHKEDFGETDSYGDVTKIYRLLQDQFCSVEVLKLVVELAKLELSSRDVPLCSAASMSGPRFWIRNLVWTICQTKIDCWIQNGNLVWNFWSSKTSLESQSELKQFGIKLMRLVLSSSVKINQSDVNHSSCFW